jgi:uncharacterized damage-inducible protein DinB
MDLTSFQRGFAYDQWANRRTLQAMKAVPGLPDRPRQVMAHILGAQRVWITRLRGENTSGLAVWPELSLEECEPLLEENARAYQQFLADRPADRLAEILHYTTSTGVEFRSSAADILTQVLLHGSYHRGQLAVAIKQHGGTPPATDFILFCREG